MKRKHKNDSLLEPVAAYDRVAQFYSTLSAARSKYIQTIDDLVIANIPDGSGSLLDVGAGDGRRTQRIAERAHIRDLVLLEPSAGMRAMISQPANIWPMRAEELEIKLPASHRQFDTITCLWNVLGHIPAEARTIVLSRLRSLLAPNGLLFLDVIHRYNMRSYGFAKTATRFLQDHLRPNESNGDVTVHWSVAGGNYETYGHVFTHREIFRLARNSGLSIEKCMVVDYATGAIGNNSWQGNLFYILRRRISTSACSRAEATSSISEAVS